MLVVSHVLFQLFFKTALCRCYVHFRGEELKLEELNIYQNSNCSIWWRWCSTADVSNSKYSIFHIIDDNMATTNLQMCSFVRSFIYSFSKYWDSISARQTRLSLSHSFLFLFIFLALMVLSLSLPSIPYPVHLLFVKNWWLCIPVMLLRNLNHFVALCLWFFLL